MRFKQTGPERGDCTTPYEVVLDRTYTVGEMITAIHTENEQEFGSIKTYEGEAPFWGIGKEKVLEVHYGSGHIKTLTGDRTILDKPVTKVVADGGWGQMHYFISTEEQI